MGDIRRVSVGIVGASGYGGVQLVRLLMDHPELELTYLGGESSAGKPFADLYPHLGHLVKRQIEAVDPLEIAERCEVVFLSLPNGLACLPPPDVPDLASIIAVSGTIKPCLSKGESASKLAVG